MNKYNEALNPPEQPQTMGIAAQYQNQQASQCSRVPFLDGLISRRHRAEQSATDCKSLDRLFYLLDKNPEIAEILGIIQDLNLFYE